MILRGSGLSAWITNSQGDPLPEYEVNQLDGNMIECWVPSVEEENFEIKFKCLEGAKSGFDLECVPFLDGVMMDGQWLSKQEVADKEDSRLYCHRTSSSTARLYQFSRHEGNVSQAEKSIQKDLNTVRVEFTWGRAGRKSKTTNYRVPKDNGPMHEKAAKKGHSGSAGLGKTITLSDCEVSMFHPQKGLESILFIFRYAPEEWLKAKEIIPCSPSPEGSSQVGKKRPRETTPEVVDVDELETDDDEIVIVKHMIPAPIHPKQKRRKSQAKVKQEESEDEDDPVAEEEQDVKPDIAN